MDGNDEDKVINMHFICIFVDPGLHDKRMLLHSLHLWI